MIKWKKKLNKMYEWKKNVTPKNLVLSYNTKIYIFENFDYLIKKKLLNYKWNNFYEIFFLKEISMKYIVGK